ncbi:MAG: hypothetical protein ACM3QS_05865 [Bacteroidota bacterium]
MEFFFPEDHLERMVPEETHLTSLTAEPYPDGRRVRVNMEITPFQTRPYIEVLLRDADSEEVASASVVEPMSWKLEFTMHLRGSLRNPYTLEARLFYPDGPSDEPRTVMFEVPSPDPADQPPAQPGS